MKRSEERASQDSISPAARYFVWLDWLRFGAAFMVLLVHARGFSFVEFGALEHGDKTNLTMIWFASTRIGHEAVIVFFVLSGFLVGGKVIERIALQRFDWRSYSIDRVTRIIVPMIPAVILAVAVDTFSGHAPTVINAVGTLLMLQQVFPGVSGINSIAPLWSLGYEVWFYVFAGALAVALLKRPTPPWIALTLLFVTLVIFTKLSTVYLFSWAIGAVVYLYPKEKFSWGEAILSITIISLGLAMYQISTASRSIHLSEWVSVVANQHIGELILSYGIALLIRNLCTFIEVDGNMSFLGHLGGKLAAFSYTLYLVHYPVLTAIQNMGYRAQTRISPQSVGLFAARILICIGISYGFYWLFERNTPTVRHYIRTKLL